MRRCIHVLVDYWVSGWRLLIAHFTICKVIPFVCLIPSQRARFPRRRGLCVTHRLPDSRSVYLGGSCRNGKAAAPFPVAQQYRRLYLKVACRLVVAKGTVTAVNQTYTSNFY